MSYPHVHVREIVYNLDKVVNNGEKAVKIELFDVWKNTLAGESEGRKILLELVYLKKVISELTDNSAWNLADFLAKRWEKND